MKPLIGTLIEERRATTQELSVRCLSTLLKPPPPPRLRGYNVPLNEAHQLKTSSPFQWRRSVRLNLSPIERFFPFFLSRSFFNGWIIRCILRITISRSKQRISLYLWRNMFERARGYMNYYVRSDIPIYFFNFRIS